MADRPTIRTPGPPPPPADARCDTKCNVTSRPYGGETLDATRDDDADDESSDSRRPGVVVVFSGSGLEMRAISVGAGPIAIGREIEGVILPDERLSRRHAEITRTTEGWRVRDLESRNGTFVDGQPVKGTCAFGAARVFRFADTLVVPCDDVRRVVGRPGAEPDGRVTGVALRLALAAVERAAATSATLLVRGESGTGKEFAARLFHACGPRARGPFVAVNCAAIPEGLAERLLFGTKRGAYSGASADAEGHVQAAHGGVLFLDEGGELDLGVQAKLLRVLETGEVVPLGASKGERVDLMVCVATHRDLRAEVASGRFRADLYHRIAPPEIVLPPLRERTDEIARHVCAQIQQVSPVLKAHARLVEACLLRAWPGNVRELQKQIRDAAAHAKAEGAPRVRLEHLPETAGQPFSPAGAPAPKSAPPRPRPYVRWTESLTREQLEKALEEHNGNVANAARALGMQRTQMYREMARFSVTRPTRQ
jgi:transcriptional regulator of acetoin/glycerol metabolism